MRRRVKEGWEREERKSNNERKFQGAIYAHQSNDHTTVIEMSKASRTIEIATIKALICNHMPLKEEEYNHHFRHDDPHVFKLNFEKPLPPLIPEGAKTSKFEAPSLKMKPNSLMRHCKRLRVGKHYSPTCQCVSELFDLVWLTQWHGAIWSWYMADDEVRSDDVDEWNVNTCHDVIANSSIDRVALTW